jgi:hypothetical protein
VVLATVVGMLIEVPVMLTMAKIVNLSCVWYESRPGILGYDEYCPAAHIHPPGV